jgi:hypothetical protein
MPVSVVDTAKVRPIYVLPHAMPIEGSQSLRTIDLMDLCTQPKRVVDDRPYNPHRGDEVRVELGVVGEQKVFYFSYFICGVGSSKTCRYPEAATIWTLTEFFKIFARDLGCDPAEMAQAVFDNTPWAA